MKTILLFPLLLLVFAPIISCEKDPEIITKTIVETDTLYVTQHDTVVLHLTDTLTLTNLIQDTATTFIVVRHAETTGIGSNPDLSAAGQVRADQLRRVLANVPLAAVFSSNYSRTTQTVQPVATEKSLPVMLYDPLNQGPLADSWLQEYKGRKVLVVGHSNTVPAFLNVLLEQNTYSTLAESEYDNLFIATVLEKGRVEVLHLKYGN